MANIKTFVFNDFQVNTYLVYDETGECIIIDPGCNTADEQNELIQFINENQLKPLYIVNTHTHIDHIPGNRFCCDYFKIESIIHRDGLPFLEQAKEYGEYFGIEIQAPPIPKRFVREGDTLMVGKTELRIMHTPGHANGSICIYNKADNWVITGDVLFQGSIGRTDLPTGNYQVLILCIVNKLLTLPKDCVVYPGHGPSTTIGNEAENNPFLK